MRSRTHVTESTLRAALLQDESDAVLHILENTELNLILQGIEGGNFPSNDALGTLLNWAIRHRQLDFITAACASSIELPDMTLTLSQESHLIPAVHYALDKQNAEALRALLQLRGDPNLVGSWGVRPGVRAVNTENDSQALALLRPLLEAMVNPNLSSSDGQSPFTSAIRNGRVNIVRRMLAYPRERIYDLAEVLFELNPKYFPRNIGQLVATMVSPEQPNLTQAMVSESHGEVKKLLTTYLERGSTAPYSSQNEYTGASLFHDPLFCKCPEDTSFCRLVRSGYFDTCENHNCSCNKKHNCSCNNHCDCANLRTDDS